MEYFLIFPMLKINLQKWMFVILAVNLFISSVAFTSLSSPQTGSFLAYSQTLDLSSHAQENAIVRAVEAANPAVVSIIISKNLPVLEQQFVNPPEGQNDPSNPFKNFLFQIPILKEIGRKDKEVGGGSGFIADSNGYIVTNSHVVEDQSAQYTVLFNDGRKLSATVVAKDSTSDVAVIKVNETNLPTLALGDSSTVKLGQTAIVIGNALGQFRNTVSVGIISGLARSITAGGSSAGAEQLSGLIQTDASINPGNSGGPLLNLDGQVIGMSTAIAQGAQSIGFAIPINDVKKIYDQIRANGKVSRAYLGVRFSAVSNGALLTKGSTTSDVAVLPGSPAQKAGLKEGDIISEVRGQRVTKDKPLQILIQKFAVGDTVPLKVIRDKKRITLSVKLEERP